MTATSNYEDFAASRDQRRPPAPHGNPERGVGAVTGPLCSTSGLEGVMTRRDNEGPPKGGPASASSVVARKHGKHDRVQETQAYQARTWKRERAHVIPGLMQADLLSAPREGDRYEWHGSAEHTWSPSDGSGSDPLLNSSAAPRPQPFNYRAALEILFPPESHRAIKLPPTGPFSGTTVATVTIPPTSDPEEILHMIQALRNDRTPPPQGVVVPARRLKELAAVLGAIERAATQALHARLTPNQRRERDRARVRELRAQGKSFREISRTIGVSLGQAYKLGHP